jgi:hypothetical protein
MTRDPTALTGELTRRTLTIRGGLSALAIGALSSCTSYGTGGAPSQAGSSSVASGGGLTTVKADIPVGRGKVFAEAPTVVTQPT